MLLFCSIGSICKLTTATPQQLEEGVQQISALEAAIARIPDKVFILGLFKLVVLPVKLALQAEADKWKAASALELYNQAKQELEVKLGRTTELRQKMTRRINDLTDLRLMVDILQNHGDAFAEVSSNVLAHEAVLSKFIP